jgi:hypothetical protein
LGAAASHSFVSSPHRAATMMIVSAGPGPGGQAEYTGRGLPTSRAFLFAIALDRELACFSVVLLRRRCLLAAGAPLAQAPTAATSVRWTRATQWQVLVAGRGPGTGIISGMPVCRRPAGL